MSVKAKFRCSEINDFTRSNNYKQREVKFDAVYGKEGDNSDYASATPSGQISMFISPNTKAYDQFQPGKEYYLTFEEAE